MDDDVTFRILDFAFDLSIFVAALFFVFAGLDMVNTGTELSRERILSDVQLRSGAPADDDSVCRGAEILAEIAISSVSEITVDGIRYVYPFTDVRGKIAADVLYELERTYENGRVLLSVVKKN